MTNPKPVQIVILGGTGDLSQRKLFPALLDLFTRGMLPEAFHVIGLARSQWGREEYADFIRKSLGEHDPNHTHTEQQIQTFCNNVGYVSGSFDDITTYTRLENALQEFDDERGVRSHRLFYLAVPPKFYQQIFVDLQNTKVAHESDDTWTHILVEKPFGNDLETAQTLDDTLAKLYREDQIFRIDHYLAKEAVQNILSFRFANNLLKAPWSNQTVESVHIVMKETIDVGERAGFYEGLGALRDVGQNHLLQLLALVAMREPKEFSVQAIRAARAEVLNSLNEIKPKDLSHSVLRGQYADYTESTGADTHSKTETYFELRAELTMPEWRGVPFFIQAGKALDVDEVSITIRLKDVATGLFQTESCLSTGNVITLTISPQQTITIELNAKAPGLGYQLETRALSFTCDKPKDDIKNSYEKVLYDSIIADQTLFTTTDEVHAAWKFITPILNSWNDTPLHSYTKGSPGPTQSIINNEI
jgi:glucose-6-phosphate 1-dehydrogenase